MDGWMDGWTDGWMDGLTDILLSLPLLVNYSLVNVLVFVIVSGCRQYFMRFRLCSET